MNSIQGHRMNFPPLMGVYLAVNALPDAVILIDGPDCSLYKAHFIFGRHDLRSTLLDIDGKHRVCFTNICAQGVTKDHNEPILRRLRLLADMETVNAILLTALPCCFITGADYEHLLRSLGTALKKPALAIPPATLAGDWLDGYAATLRTLARHIDLKGARPKSKNVAIIGYLMDRNEGDHRANLRHLSDILERMGLHLVSTWLDGRPYRELARVKDAGLIISLPYARQAAEEIAQKTGATIVETELPFGLASTQRWVRQIARAAGRIRAGENLLRSEIQNAMESLEWIIPKHFLHRTAAYIGDPFLMRGFDEICDDLGLELTTRLVTGRESRTTDFTRPAIYDPTDDHPVVKTLLSDAPDLIVTNTNDVALRIRRRNAAIVELGFPSYFHHAVASDPFLGFEGFLTFTGRMADALSMQGRSAMIESLDQEMASAARSTQTR